LFYPMPIVLVVAVGILKLLECAGAPRPRARIST
jgi:hypothetical protein